MKKEAAAESAVLSAAAGPSSTTTRVGSGSDERVKGPWSPEEDAVLSRLVGKFGARNWSLIARGIPGRSGKSCRLRWCNQLDPCVKRKPFTGKLLMAKYPSVFWTPCAAHCIDLILHDIGKLSFVKKTLKKNISLNGYIYNHPFVLNMMRSFTKQRELIRPAVTHFATAFLTLQSIQNQKHSLRAMFCSEEWLNSRYHQDTGGRVAYEIVMQTSFWTNILYVLKVTGPIVRVLRLVDSEKKPAMGYIYEAMDRAKEAIKRSFNDNEAKYEKIWNIIDLRWNVQLHHPLHAVGYYLNPEFYYTTEMIESIEELNYGLVTTIEKLVPDVRLQDKIHQELNIFKEALGLMGSSTAIWHRTTLSPDEEDRIIVAAHATHGNKWASIARLLPGRTDNAVKNHWNSTLRRRCNHVDMLKVTPYEILEDISGGKTKASSEETISGDVNSFKSLGGKDVPVPVENIFDHSESKPQIQHHFKTEPPSLFRPVARVSAFSLYNPEDCPTKSAVMPRPITLHGPLIQPTEPNSGTCKFLDNAYSEPHAPARCAHGCCRIPIRGNPQSSLLGPEFVDFEELPLVASHELVSIAVDISNIAWIKSGLESGETKLKDNLVGEIMSQGMLRELMRTHMSQQPLAPSATLEGLS